MRLLRVLELEAETPVQRLVAAEVRQHGDEAGEHLEAGVRVDAPLSGPRDRLVALEREPGGMGEQVPDGRARRAGRLVEVDRGFLGGDEDGERGRELGHGRPAEDAPVSVPGEHPARQERGRGGVGRSPLLDLTQSVHPGDTTAAMEPWSYDFRGRLDEHVFESEALKGNPLGDPHERPLWVYVPPGYDDNPERRYPSVYAIQGMTGQVDMWRNRFPFRKNFPELADDLFADGGAKPCVLVYVDCWTSLGGSQFLDSPGTGRYHTYLCEEVVPWVDANYRTLPAAEHRGIAGKSSGGYGAMVTPMLRPDLFGGLATHAGDALFECCYQAEFAQVARSLRDDFDGSYERFWEDFRSRPAFSRKDDMWLVNIYCMAACYSAGELPFTISTGELRRDVFDRWLEWDTVRMVPRHADALRSMRAIWIDAGKRDEYFLDLGAEAFRTALAGIGVTDVHFELFDATHGLIEYRYPLALRYLTERLS